jgi:hypothetical protein
LDRTKLEELVSAVARIDTFTHTKSLKKHVSLLKIAILLANLIKKV